MEGRILKILTILACLCCLESLWPQNSTPRIDGEVSVSRDREQALLNSAQLETDPISQKSKFQECIRNILEPDFYSVECSELLFFLIDNHPGLFGSDQLLSAAKEWSNQEKSYYDSEKEPSRMMYALSTISDRISHIAPVTSFEYASEGIDFLERHWPEMQAGWENHLTSFWEIQLRCYLALGDWKPAERIGKALVDVLERGYLTSGDPILGKKQQIRREYAKALESQGKIVPALDQLGMATVEGLDSQKVFDSFVARHAELSLLASSQRKVWLRREEQIVERRNEILRTTLLDTREHLAVEDFNVPLMGGGVVSLSSFRGKPLVLAFWATWCGPCRGELEKLDQAFRADDNRTFHVLGVSIDYERNQAEKFASNLNLVLPLAYAGQSLSKEFDTTTLPHLYVFDREGYLAFEETGFTDDFAHQLTWMLDALSAGPNSENKD